MPFDTPEQRRAYQRERIRKIKAKGICPNCQKAPASEGKTCCEDCLYKKRANRYNQKFGLSSEWVENKLREQRGVCAICHEPMKTINVDHNHKSGGVRGILCTSCNTSLGKFKDDIRVLIRAAAYLDRYGDGDKLYFERMGRKIVNKRAVDKSKIDAG